MPRLADADPDRQRAQLIRLGWVACAVALVVAAVIAGLRAPRFGWVLANSVLIGLPACVLIIVAREALRIAVAHLLGFRLFGVRWGAGRQIASWQGWGVHHHLGWLPISADARVASPHPAHHRLRRWIVALLPALVQATLAGLGLALGALSFQPLVQEFDWLVVGQWVNLVLLALHVLVPFETDTGMCSDLRLALILSLTTVEEDRAARASAHVMRIERALAAGEIERAEALLAPAIVQLGREPMLVQLEDRIARIRVDPDPKAAARADATTDPFEHSWSYWGRTTGPLPFLRRLSFAVAALAPIALALFLFSTFHSAPLLASIHDRSTQQALAVADANDADRCQAHLPAYRKRVERLAAVATIPPITQIRELATRARLSACGGDFERAIRDQSLALQIAERIRANATMPSGTSDPDPLAGDLLVSSELRALSLLQAQRGSYRDALRTTGTALRELARVQDAATARPDPDRRESDLGRIEEERAVIESTRSQILEGMYARS